MPEKPSILMPALYGGLIMAVISAVPGLNLINCLCCAGVMLGGFLAVFFYQKDLTPQSPPLTNGDGLKLGALAGVFGAVVGTILGLVVVAAFGNVGADMVLDVLRGFEDSMPPGTMEQIEQQMSESAAPGFLTIIMNFLGAIVIYPLFGLIGGLIGYSVYKPKPGSHMPMPPTTPTGV
jgi:hypothetical protein